MPTDRAGVGKNCKHLVVDLSLHSSNSDTSLHCHKANTQPINVHRHTYATVLIDS